MDNTDVGITNYHKCLNLNLEEGRPYFATVTGNIFHNSVKVFLVYRYSYHIFLI